VNMATFENIEADARHDQSYADLEAALKGFDTTTGNRQTFYRYQVLNPSAALTDGEARLLAPLVKSVLGIPPEDFLRDTREQRRQVEAVKRAQNGATPAAPSAALFHDVRPWDDPIDGADLLDAIADHFRQYVVLPDHAADAVAAWAVCTWLQDTLYFAPLLALLSPTKRSGKTLLFDLLRPIIHRGYLTAGVGVTPAVLFRLTDKYRPTLLIDEAEKLSSDKEARDVIGLLNVGFRRGAKILRCEGERFEPRSFEAYGFRGLAAIGRLWDTVTDRSIVIGMTRKAKGANVARFQAQRADRDGQTLARQIARWTADKRSAIEAALPITPRPLWLHDRACDNWSSLFAVGMVAGRDWLTRLQTAAKILSTTAEDDGDRRELLLADLHNIFMEQGQPAFITTADLLKALIALEGSPWGDLNGRELSKQRLAAMLRPFGIKPTIRREGYGTARGYELAAFSDAFARYLPPPVQVETSKQPESRNTEPPNISSDSDNCFDVSSFQGGKECNDSGSLQEAVEQYGPE
jgi:putative DNA primase/helicase